MAPSILWLDEIEKTLTGVGDDAKTSGGLKTELFGYWLSWFDRRPDVYVMATCNDITKLSNSHPELLRRFDRMFFVDFPGREAKDQIWTIHAQGYGLVTDDPQPLLAAVRSAKRGLVSFDDSWTGAEIEKCCSEARMMLDTDDDDNIISSQLDIIDAVLEAGTTLVRLIDQAPETIRTVRDWASGRCYSAEEDAIFRAATVTESGSGARRIGRASPTK
jgi:SpoVK/Ycf46/Vps4 family AAA+-type ATPase